ncbi:MAG: hypothetical protein CMJ19_19225 [Phycisphaeraceae bacterium]|nr:hypothetical protein [Phycisphaeraceae bacterium]
MIKKSFHIVLLLCLCHAILLHAQDANNLIENSGFADKTFPPASWEIINSSRGVLSIEQEGDLRYLRMEFSDMGRGGITQSIKLMPDVKALSVSAWLRGNGIIHGGQDYQRGCFEFFFYDAKGQRLGGFPKLMVPNSADWKKYAQVREVPDGAVSVRVSCVNHGGKGVYDFANLNILGLTQKQLLLSSQNDLKLQAKWSTKNRYAIYEPGEKVELQFTVQGSRAPGETILWQLFDHQQKLKQGEIAVPAGSGPFSQSITLSPERYGYFQVKARLSLSGVMLPKRGTAPAGCVTFGILPNIEALPLKHMDDSRFGVQGTTFIDTGKFMQGDPYNAYYKALGVRWVHRNRRLHELEPVPNAFKPRVTAESLKHAWPYDWDNRMAPLVDAHGVPQWLIDGPRELREQKNYSNTFDAQKYPPRDDQAYGNILEKVAREMANLHEHRFTYMKHNYYQIQWEPDWYWLGSDEQLVQMYRTAYQSIHAADPNAQLLGCNFGVLQTGNDWMARMFRLGLGKWMDGIVTHAYYTYKAPPEIGIRPQMQRLVQMVHQYMGPDTMIMHSEWGDHWDGDYVTQSISPDQLRDEMSHNLRGHLIVLGEGADATWFFYAADLGKRGGGMAFNLEPNPRYGPTIISPKPLTMGVATMTRLLEGTTNLGVIDYMGVNVLGYAFDRDGQTILALWSTDGKSHTIKLPAQNNVRLCDSFGNSSALITDAHMITVTLSDLPSYVIGLSRDCLPNQTVQAYPGQSLEQSSSPMLAMRGAQTATLLSNQVPTLMQTGTWLLASQHPQTGELSNFKRLVVANALKMKLMPTKDKTTSGYQLQVQNFSDQDQTVKVQIQNEFQTLAIPTNKSSTLFLEGSQLQLDDGFYRLNAWDQAGRKLTASVSARSLLNTFTHTPKIDGNWRDWQLEMFQRVGGDEALVYRKAPLIGPKDFSFDYALAHDDKALYGIFKVSDDTHLPPTNPNQTWRGDSIQITFGLDLRANGDWGSLRRISLHLPTDQQAAIAREVIGPPPIPPVMGQLLDDSQLRCRVQRDDQAGMTVYEFAIPLSQIGSKDQLAKYKHIGFGALINDADTLEQISDDARKTMTVAEGAGLFSLHPKLGLFPLDIK